KQHGNLEMLSKPSRLIFTHEKPREYPAWNMDWADRKNPPMDVVQGPAEIRIIERGPVRIALEIERQARGSIIKQTIRLAPGDAGQRIEFVNELDWQSTGCALKASFPFTASNPMATYNWGMGIIERGNNEPTKFEVPSHEWIDLTDKSGEFGVSILEDCKFGSDKPSDNELRLTLLYTPAVRKSFLDQHSQDWGRHDITYALYGHTGDWRKAKSEWQARRLNQPLIPFQTKAHPGEFGRQHSVLSVSTDQVDIRAVKLAERGDEMIVRLQELTGRPAEKVSVSFKLPVRSLREVDGQERPIGELEETDRTLMCDLGAYSPRTFALGLALPRGGLSRPITYPVALEYDIDIASRDNEMPKRTGLNPVASRGKPLKAAIELAAGALLATMASAGAGTLPADMLPSKVVSEGIEFDMGPTTGQQANAVECCGQVIDLPAGDFDHLYFLAMADEDTLGDFVVGGQATEVEVPWTKLVEIGVQHWTGFIGQWDDRVWDRQFEEIDFRCEGKVVGFKTGYIKRDPIAWFCTHRHHPFKGNEAYQFSYLFKYGFELPPGAKQVTLPRNRKIKIAAITVAKNPNDCVRPAAPLYDDFTGRKPVELRYKYPEPPPPVFEGVKANGVVTSERQDSFEKLKMEPPSKNDYADQASGHGVAFRPIDPEGKYPPNSSSGLKDGDFVRLNDGEVAQNHDDAGRCVWYDNEGRFFCDLGRSVNVGQVNTYSWHRSNRAPQYFSLWGSNEEKMPPAEITHKRQGDWTLLGVVKTDELGQGGVHSSSISGSGGSLGEYRWLMWIAEDVGEGTFFTEIDIHASDADSSRGAATE
ncbi:MAG TPA: glycoside hydrolase family 38 C-terminal domain-containing protein, partial [Phycisphaerae bacterium]|nr:glycoside hydrolase family 38 C-terminal domain-containing protein [Phycisphaerae bacterium]